MGQMCSQHPLLPQGSRRGRERFPPARGERREWSGAGEWGPYGTRCPPPPFPALAWSLCPAPAPQCKHKQTQEKIRLCGAVLTWPGPMKGTFQAGPLSQGVLSPEQARDSAQVTSSINPHHLATSCLGSIPCERCSVLESGVTPVRLRLDLTVIRQSPLPSAREAEKGALAGWKGTRSTNETWSGLDPTCPMGIEAPNAP